METKSSNYRQVVFWWITSIAGCMVSVWFVVSSPGSTSLMMGYFMLSLSVLMCIVTFIGSRDIYSGSHANNSQITKKGGAVRLDCSACKKAQSMKQAKIPRFTGLVRFIGFLIATPSAIGVCFALIIFSSTIFATNEMVTTAPESASGAVMAAGIGIVGAAIIGFGSLVGGVLGWILLMKKKVFKCVRCGYILDRA